ncbi:hypothetical protein Cs7R123_29310 [Catellatospora sp. TT07R-123]|uniref:hypothetical protein n=1 Tax=Catellatospora sp. TT07R-123 TaxID=2733863 RepID=UPI001B1DF5A2|nr:hypothetical protein [Catellatospora sp. TT07R-123]GHJ45589.1 hypothetical protein Cs7R123_29310 [Catellatospora sp. TT07R-123]
MTDVGNPPQYFWCVKHHRVETGQDRCPAKNLLGPYPTAAEAEQALQRVQDRNEQWDEDDARWTGQP